MKQIVKRYIKWMIITLILLSIFKCSSSGDNTNKTVLKVFTQPRWAPYLKKAQLKWDKIHPQNRIKLQILELGYPQLRSKLITAAGGDNAPDFSLIDVVWIAEFVEAGYLKSIDELDSAWVDTVFCQDWYQSLVNAVSYQNHIYGLVTQTGTEHLYYRRDWFWQEGIEPPETWQQLIDVATHFQQDFIRKKYRMGDYAMDLLGGVRGDESTTARWLLALWSANGKIIDNFYDIVFDDFPSKMALELYYDLVHIVGGSYEWTMLQKQTGWDDQTMREKIGFIPFPAATVGQKVVGTGGMAYCIFKQSHNQKLALEFLKKVLSDQLLSNFCITTNQTPPRKSVVASLDSSKHWFLWKNAQMLKWARSRPTSPIYPKFSEQIQKMLELTISREIDPYSAVSNVEKEMKNELINLNTPQ